MCKRNLIVKCVWEGAGRGREGLQWEVVKEVPEGLQGA